MKLYRLLLCLLIMLLTTACRKELCYEHEEHAMRVRLDIKADWETIWERDYGCNWSSCWNSDWGCNYDDLCPVPATGIRSLVYNSDGSVYDERNFLANGGRLYLAEDTYSFLFYNNDTEYIVYDGLGKIATAVATTRSLTRNTFTALHQSERTVSPPDMLYGHFVEQFEGQLSDKAHEYSIVMKPLVYTYLIRYEFNAGLQYVGLARGALAGMAKSVYLHDGHTGSEPATLLYDCTIEEYGAEARVMTFGIPNHPDEFYNRGEEQKKQHYTLNLEVRLTNGDFKNFYFDVTDQIVTQPRGGVIVVSGLEVTDDEGKQPESEGGGFDIGLEGWGDAIDVPLPL